MGDIFMPQPIDRSRLHEKKLAKMQQEIDALEEKMRENASLRRRLENISNEEQRRTQSVIDKMNSRNSVLREEIDRFYREKSPLASPSPTQLVSDLISRRTKEFSTQQHEKALQYKQLMAEKQRLQAAQERLREKRLALHRMPTPEDEPGRVSRPVSMESVHSNASIMHRAVLDMPHTVHRIWQLKEDIHHDYETRRKPYRGELGMQSYQPWQLDDYLFIRRLVEDFVEDFVSKFIPPDYSNVEHDIRWALQRADEEEWQRTAGALSERRAVQLVAEAVLLQETRSLMRQTAAEVIHVNGTFKNMTDTLMMREAEMISLGQDSGREVDDPAYNLITKSFFTAQKNRIKFRKDVWTHTQPLQLATSKPVKEHVLRENIDTDVELITYHHLHPTDLLKFKASQFDLPAKKKKECEVWYRNREAQFWTAMEPGLITLQIPSVCQGVQCMAPSPDGFFVIVGTVRGDILLYDVRMEPWQLARVVPFRVEAGGQPTDAVVHLTWSLDATRVVSVTKTGKLQLWVLEGGEVSRLDARTLQLKADEHSNIPKLMKKVAELDADNNDFVLQQGPLAESELLKEKHKPVRGAFFPSFSLFGVQHSVCGLLENGDIMKINLESFSVDPDNTGGEFTYPDVPLIYNANIYDESHEVNLVGKNLEAELFRQHRHPVMHLGFIDNISRMVSVDDNGYINIWHYSPTYFSGFGYFIPEKKYKLDFNKNMYTPSNSDKPKVIFTDSVKNNTKSQEEIVKERTSVQKQLDSMNLGDPWHEEVVPNRNLVRSVYAPRGGVKDSGAMFNIVLHHESTLQLSTYLIRMYKPVKVKCSKLLGVIPTPSGRELVFVLLFPQYPPKEAHMMIVVLDLITMKLRDLRRDIHLSNADHDKLMQEPLVSFATTRVLAPTGADYLFIMIEGRLRCVSLTTGNLVLRAEDPRKPSGFIGCAVDEKSLKVGRTGEVTSVCCSGHIYAALHDKGSTKVQVLKLSDQNEYEERRLMWKAYQLRTQNKPVPPEIRVDKMTWLLSNTQHAEVEMRRLILELVDKKVFNITEGEDKEFDSQRALHDKTEQYKVVVAKVEKMDLLEKEKSADDR